VPGNDPLHKVTIIPRGRALGVTMNLPETDRYSLKFREITAKLAMMFGGRLAEEIIYGPENVSTGASNDIQQATNLARRDGDGMGHEREARPPCATSTTRKRCSSATR
jgi:cell division protease FtsH